jgi:hypothetical protein
MGTREMGEMADRGLPDEGPLHLGSVTLPAGRLITANYGSGEPVAWVTTDPVPEAGRVWNELTEMHHRTGLVPILLDGLHGDIRRPWDQGEFEDPWDIREADSLDIDDLLEDLWDSYLPDEDEDDEDTIRARAPFSRQFPGAAPAEHIALTEAERWRAFDTLLPPMRRVSSPAGKVRIGLVPADRPADVLAALGWTGLTNNWPDFPVAVTAVLRSWEERFGARLVDVGFADIRLLVERPPRTVEAAERVAAEHVMLADECIDGRRDIPGIAARLVKSPVWAFWWD